jgi:hypothetical protein
MEGRSTVWGSGYPSDPKTVDWIKANTDTVFGFPSNVRFSWAPVRNHLKDQAAASVPTVATVEWSDDEDDDGAAAANAAAAKGTAKLSSFFSAAPQQPAGSQGQARGGGGGAGVAKRARLAPFRARKLTLVEDF